VSRETDLIGPIAAFIGARLHYPNPEVNGQGNPWVSTIKVDQHKEKFWKVRVYCDLAAPGLVKQKWEWYKANFEVMKQRPSRYFPHIDTTAEEPSPEFFDRCVKGDAMYYREVYMEMVELQPHLRSKICSEADHTELLFGSLQELLTRLDEMQSKGDNWLTSYFTKYRVKDLNGLRDFMKVVYEPSFKDTLSVSG
jgi:hypothetical protein